MSKKLNLIAQLVVVLGGALSLKFYYSTASVNQLRWILTPTTRLVEFVTGRTFTFESYAGYMSSDHTFLIATSCAGVNFLITAFLLLSLRRLWLDVGESRKRSRFLKGGWIYLPVAAVLSFVATVVANTVRISIALQMQQARSSFGFLNAEQLHRIEGILVYFGFLLLLFVVSEKTMFRTKRGMIDQSEKTGSGLLRPWLFPLGVYYAITLGLPFANGALRQGRDFIDHSLFVLVIPLLLVSFVATLQFGKSFTRRVALPFLRKGIGRRSTLGTASEVIQTG